MIPRYGAWLLALAVGSLVTLSVQYPLSSTLPMGSDAAAHVRNTQRIIADLASPAKLFPTLKSILYPLSNLTFLPSAILPIEWPVRFIWWVALGQIVSGLALGLLVYRLAGWPGAAAAMAIWALTPVTIQHHFEDGTMPQLWSLPWLLLFFERSLARSSLGTLLALGGTFLSHPFSGLVLFAVLAIAALPLWCLKHTRRLLGAVVAGGALLAYSVLRRTNIGGSFPRELVDYYFGDMLTSTFTPWIILAVAGWSLFAVQKRPRAQVVLMLSFLFVALATALNHLLGAGFLTHRFASYFVLVVVIGAALALPPVVQSVFRRPASQMLFVFLLFTTLFLWTWHNNARVHAHYESTVARP